LAKFVAEAAEASVTPMIRVLTLVAYLEQLMEHVRAHRQPDTKQQLLSEVPAGERST